MRPVERGEVLDYARYAERRAELQARIRAIKAPRRVHVGEHLTFLFENRDTVLYQVQEMIRVERLVREADIQHELDTYNELLGGAGELGCVLMLEIPSVADRDRWLVEWRDLPSHVYARLEDGSPVPAAFDPRQVGERRLSSVQYLKFRTGGRVPVALGTTLPALALEAALTDAQRAALAADLA